MNIGEKIRDLRKKQDVTQEKLAAYLSISYQAVSKWENGTALPDITLIPQIANFFGVTADELLGMRDAVENDELNEYERIYIDSQHKGDVLKRIELAREVLKKYPRNFYWMLKLAMELKLCSDTEAYAAYAMEHGFSEEAAAICERILEDCTVDSLRHGAIETLCFVYAEMNRSDEAVRIANEMPSFYTCRERLLTQIYCGEEQIRACQSILVIMVREMFAMIWMLNSQELMGNELSNEQKIALYRKAISLMELFFDNENDIGKGIWVGSMQRLYERISVIYAQDEDVENVTENLLLAERYANATDENMKKGEAGYESLLLNRLRFQPQNILFSRDIPSRECLLRIINEDANVRKMRDVPEIAALIERLSAK